MFERRHRGRARRHGGDRTDRDSNSNCYGKWYRVAYGNAEWHDNSDGNTKRDSKRYGKS